MKKNMVMLSFVISSLLIFIPGTFAQSLNKDNPVQLQSHNLDLDSRNVSYNYQPVMQAEATRFQNTEKKSPLLAGVLSAVLPGAGEFYDESYLKAAIFVVVEAAAITTAIVYNNKGNNQTQFFQNYANSNWSVSRYAHWTAQNISTLAPDMPKADVTKFQNAFPTDQSPVDWNTLNQMETEIGNTTAGTGGGYTHQLVAFGEQQYYELIGKYDQYSKGWAQSNHNNNDYTDLPRQMLDYDHMRGVANDYYAVGATGVKFIFVNHILSIFDAVWTASRFNKSVAMNVRFDQRYYATGIKFVPTLHVSVNF